MATFLPSPKKKKRQHIITTNFQLCIKCQCTTRESLNNVTHDSLATIMTVLNARCDDISQRLLKDLQDEDVFFGNHPKWHRSCRATWTSKSNIKETGQASTSDMHRVTRSCSDDFDFKTMCVVCGCAKLCGKNKHQNLICVGTRAVQETLYGNAVQCNDESILVRIRGDVGSHIDMIANGVKYHKLCYDRLRQRVKARNCVGNNLTLYDTAFSLLVNDIDGPLKMGKLYHVSTLNTMYRHNLVTLGFDKARALAYRNDNLKKKLQKHYDSKICFLPQTGSVSDIVCNAEISAAELLKAWQELKCDVDENFVQINTDDDDDDDINKVTDVFDIHLIYRLAQQLKSDLRDIKTQYRKNLPEFYDVSHEQASAMIPHSLYNLVACMLSDTNPDNVDNDGRIVTSQDIHECILNISQDVVYSVTGLHTPKHVGLAVYVCHKTRSKDIITMLNRLGLCISYSELQRVLMAVEAEVDEQTDDDNVFIPANIVTGQFTQFAIDNLDFSECTLDGSSMHMTSMVMYQPRVFQGGVFGKVPAKVRRKHRLHENANDPSIISLNAMHYKRKLKRQLIPIKNNDMVTKFLRGYESDTPNMNLCWKLLRFCPSKLLEVEVDCPGWKVFNAMLKHKHIPATAIGYCPFLPKSPTDPAVVEEAVKICMKTSKKLGMTHTVVTQDEAIYEIIYTLRKNTPAEYQNLILRLGGFHLLMNYLGAIGKLMNGSGLKELFVYSQVLKEGTAEKVLTGKGYYQAFNAHMHVYEALESLRWDAFENWVMEEGINVDIMTEITDLMAILGKELQEGDPTTQTTHNLDKSLAQIKVLMEQCAYSKNEYKTYRFWCNYLNMIEILLSYIHAERSGVWQEHLSATAQMAEYIAAADHVKYIKAVVCYLNEMGNLPNVAPEIHEAFECGHFTVKQSAREFNAIWTDMALECSQNCDAKGRSGQAGLKGITLNKNAQKRWFKTLPFAASVSTSMKEMIHIHSQGELHHEDSSATKKRQRDSRDNILSTVGCGQIVNPFVYDKKHLVSIADGRVASEQISNDLLDAQKHGKKVLKDFIDTGTTKKLNLHTFSVIKPCKKQATQKMTINELANETVSLKRLVMELERGVHTVELKEALKHELHNYPPALAVMNSTSDRVILRTGNKSSLLTMLKRKCGLTEWPLNITEWKSKSGLVVDVMALVRMQKPLSNERGDTYACRILSAVVKGTDYNEIHMVADRYDGVCIEGDMGSGISLKDASGCRDRRGQSQMEYSVSSSHVIKNWENILSNSISKCQLLQFLYEQWSGLHHIIPDGVTVTLAGGFKTRTEVRILRNINSCPMETHKHEYIVKMLSSTQEEADTRIFLSIAACIHMGCSRVVIKASDTDIVVISAYVYSHLSERGVKELFMQTKDYFVPIHHIIQAIDTDEAKMLPLVHALSGCDTTSFFYGKSKQSFYAAAYANKANLARICFQIETENVCSSLIDQALSVAQSVTVAVYHPQSFNSLNALRQHLYIRKKRIQLLPPTDDAFRQHVLRTIFQTCVWVKALQTHPSISSPLEFGWMLLPSGVHPILMTTGSLPSSMQGTLFCNCKQMCVRNCPCSRKQLACDVACSCRGDINMCVRKQLEVTDDEDAN